MKDPAIVSLAALRRSALRAEDQPQAYDALWSALSYAGMHLAGLFEAELGEAEAMIAIICAARSTQYEREAAENLTEEFSELDPVRGADLQATAALCAMATASLLAPTEKAVHAMRLSSLLDELDELDPVAADWHRLQRSELTSGRLIIPTPSFMETPAG